MMHIIEISIGIVFLLHGIFICYKSYQLMTNLKELPMCHIEVLKMFVIILNHKKSQKPCCGSWFHPMPQAMKQVQHT
jgi:uncharacterized protein YneF (UPF0154 family)